MLDQYLKSNEPIRNKAPYIRGNNSNDEEGGDCVNEKYLMKESTTQGVRSILETQNRKDKTSQGQGQQERLTSIHQLDTLKNSNQEEENETSMDNYIQIEKEGRGTSNNKPIEEHRCRPSMSNDNNDDEEGTGEINAEIEEEEEEGELEGEADEIPIQSRSQTNNPTQSNINNNNNTNTEEDCIQSNNSKLKQIQLRIHSQLQSKQQIDQQHHQQQQIDEHHNDSSLNAEWNSKYDQLVLDCKEKLRADKEAKLTRQMQDKLRPQIEKEIYKSDYAAIVTKLRDEIEAEINKEFEEKKKEEIVAMKRKMDYLAKVKTEEIEKVVMQKCKEEIDKETQRETSMKESEYKLKYMQRYEAFKSALEKKLMKDYEEKKKEVKREVDEIKAKLYRSKCSENLKINKINRMKKNIKEYQRKNMKNSQQVERIINTKDIEGDGGFDEEAGVEGNEGEIGVDKENDCDNNNGYGYKEPIEDNKTGYNENNSVNLFELNNKLKNNIINTKEINDNKPKRGLIEPKKSQSLNQSKASNEPTNKHIITKQCIMSPSNIMSITPNINQSQSPNDSSLAYTPSKILTKASYDNKAQSPLQPQSQPQFYSMHLDPSIPTTFADFGKFLISHIEKEDNYRLLFQSELKKLKTQIRKLFKSEKRNDHCLTDYMLELWNKLEISYAMRYSILKSIVKMTPSEAYAFLDTETENLTNYYQSSEEIYKKIKSRESLKVKLQTKLNRNELMAEDQMQLDQLTTTLHELIDEFKTSGNSNSNNTGPTLDIIWKGLRYEWFMNYEKWFYDIRKAN